MIGGKIIDRKKFLTLPQTPGVYIYRDDSGKVVYVGKSINLRSRVSSYFKPTEKLLPKTAKLVEEIRKIEYIEVETEVESLLLEANLIKKYLPKYNIVVKDDKSPIYIKIDFSSNVPKVLAIRKPKYKIKRGDYVFGPYPSSKTVTYFLKNIRKVIPFCTHNADKRPCLYVHLGLCPDPYRSESNRLEYKKNLKILIKFLSGKYRKIISDLNRQMLQASKDQKFEDALSIKKQIEGLTYVTQKVRNPDEYLKSPNLLSDLNLQKIKALKKILNLPKTPKRIECYDISNFQGTNATGSMVVLTSGAPDKSQYRRFRIKTKNTPDDFAMHKEMFKRRLKNSWTLPDLFVIDGGKGQVSTAYSILQENNINIPLIGLAKRLEEIFLPNNPKPILLERNSPALLLLQQIRDESHRFAITYHRHLRKKKQFEGIRRIVS